MKHKYPTEDHLERIADAQWNGDGNGVHLSDVYQHNACNHTLSGTIKDGDEVYGFIIESGDWNGTVVLGWGHVDNVGEFDHPEPPEPFTFVPTSSRLHINRPHLFQEYLAWRQEKWFKDKEMGYNYDSHLAPGGKTETYYREWAAEKGLALGLLSNHPEITNAEKGLK
jgi:hypothetical protein